MVRYYSLRLEIAMPIDDDGFVDYDARQLERQIIRSLPFDVYDIEVMETKDEEE